MAPTKPDGTPKRGRGRPPKDPSERKTATRVSTGRPRGRPKGSGGVKKATKAAAAAATSTPKRASARAGTGRGPGRPRKSDAADKTDDDKDEAAGTTRGGRKSKGAAAAAAASSSAAATPSSGIKRGRGRPRKSASAPVKDEKEEDEAADEAGHVGTWRLLLVLFLQDTRSLLFLLFPHLVPTWPFPGLDAMPRALHMAPLLALFSVPTRPFPWASWSCHTSIGYLT